MKKELLFWVLMPLPVVALYLATKTTPIEVVELRDYAQIDEVKEIRAVTEYNSLSFYPEKGEIKGFHYELLQAFAQSRGWEVVVEPEMSIEKQVAAIMEGKYDLLANSRAITSSPTDSLRYTEPFLLTQLVLIQRKAATPQDSLHITTPLQLANKKIYVTKGSPAILRIQNLSNEIGDTIYIEEVEKYGSEQLLAMVAGGDIDYAVCEKSLAQAWEKDLPQLDMKQPIGFTQRYAWGVSPAAPALLDTLNHWLENYTQTGEFKRLRKKYYNY
ncbi:MAG: transporter substrate-binding domain-containing protein [Phocaeicola sp.]